VVEKSAGAGESSFTRGLGWSSGNENPKARRKGRLRRKKGEARGRKAVLTSMLMMLIQLTWTASI
jgi:hypothetical protein